MYGRRRAERKGSGPGGNDNQQYRDQSTKVLVVAKPSRLAQRMAIDGYRLDEGVDDLSRPEVQIVDRTARDASDQWSPDVEQDIRLGALA